MQDEEGREAMVTREGAAEKLPYEAPELVRYGSVTELTEGSGGANTGDAGSPIP
jgi:hypothetical protein